MFAERGEVPALVAIEYMAQTVGVWAGLDALRRNQPPRMGLLLGTRELQLTVDAFYAGDQLRIEAQHTWGDESLGNFHCEVKRRGETVARADLNVALTSAQEEST